MCANQRVNYVMRGSSGMTLMEVTLALALVGVALPMVMMVVSQAGHHSRSGLMQTEIGRAILSHATEMMNHGPYRDGEQRVWAYDVVGRCLGEVDEDVYQEGLSEYEGQRVRYLVAAKVSQGQRGEFRPLSLRVEHPAVAAVMHRKRIKFHAWTSP